MMLGFRQWEMIRLGRNDSKRSEVLVCIRDTSNARLKGHNLRSPFKECQLTLEHRRSQRDHVLA